MLIDDNMTTRLGDSFYLLYITTGSISEGTRMLSIWTKLLNGSVLENFPIHPDVLKVTWKNEFFFSAK